MVEWDFEHWGIQYWNKIAAGIEITTGTKQTGTQDQKEKYKGH